MRLACISRLLAREQSCLAREAQLSSCIVSRVPILDSRVLEFCYLSRERYTVPVRVLKTREKGCAYQKDLNWLICSLLMTTLLWQFSPILENNATAQVSEEEKEILWSLVSEVGDNISPDEKNQLFALLLEYADIFSLASADLGHTTVLKHKIDTGSAVSVHHQLTHALTYP